MAYLLIVVGTVTTFGAAIGTTFNLIMRQFGTVSKEFRYLRIYFGFYLSASSGLINERIIITSASGAMT